MYDKKGMRGKNWGKDASTEVYITIESSTGVLVEENNTDLEEFLLLIFALGKPVGE